MPRQVLTFVRLPMPALARGRLLDSVRLQLTQYMPSGPFGFVCHAPTGGSVQVWAWTLGAEMGSPQRGSAWPEPALDAPASDGLHLRRRSAGFEAQQWAGGELLHSRWFASPPEGDDWERFARGCGVAPADHPLPAATVARPSAHPTRGWLAGDSLPAPDRWQGWRWQAALLALGAVAAAGLGMHLQAGEQLRLDSQRLQDLRSGREAALHARAGYEQTATELEALRALVPRLSQLELFDRVTASGAFAPIGPAGAAQLAGAKLLDWDYRSGQLKLTVELPERDLTLLDITRRIEKVPGLGTLRVGQDSVDNTLSLTAAVTELAPPGAVR